MTNSKHLALLLLAAYRWNSIYFFNLKYWIKNYQTKSYLDGTTRVEKFNRIVESLVSLAY